MAKHTKAMMAALSVLTGVAIVLAVGTLLLLGRVDKNTGRIDRASTLALTTAVALSEHTAIFTHSLYATDWRICVRQMEVRAALILHVDVDSREPLYRYLPIFDCRPDLYGGTATLLSPKDQAAYLRHFDHGKALAP
jgi:hypothetical protein